MIDAAQIKKENRQLRKALTDTNKNYVAVVNENLALRRYIEKLSGNANPILDTV